MAERTGIFVSVLDLAGNQVFHQLEGITGSSVHCASQAAPDTKVKILVRIPDCFNLHGAGGLSLSIAIDHENEQMSHTQTYWYDAANIKSTTTMSHSCFYIWPPAWRTMETPPVEQQFTVPAQQGLQTGDTVPQRGCITVSLTRGSLTVSHSTTRTLFETLSVVQPHPELQYEVEKSPRVISKDWFNTLPGELGMPLTWVFSNGMKSSNADTAADTVSSKDRIVTAAPSREELEVSEVLKAQMEPVGPDRQDSAHVASNGEKETSSVKEDDNRSDQDEPRTESEELQVTELAVFSPEEIEIAEWRSLCDWLEHYHPKEYAEVCCTSEEQQTIKWLEKHNPDFLTRFRQAERALPKGDLEEEENIRIAEKISEDEIKAKGDRLLDEGVDCHHEEVDSFDDSVDDSAEDQDFPQQSHDGSDDLAKQLNGVQLEKKSGDRTLAEEEEKEEEEKISADSGKGPENGSEEETG